MSQSSALPRTRGAARPSARRTPRVAPLRVVPAAGARPGTAAFASLCLALLVGGLVGLLMLNTAMAEGSYRLHALEATSGELADTQEALSQAIDAQSAPASLAERARGMGMLPAESTAYLRLSDGKVLGVAKPAPKTSPFKVVTAPVPLTRGSKALTGGPRTTVTTSGTATTTTVTTAEPDGGTATTTTTVDAATGETTTQTTTTPARSAAAPAVAD